MTTAQLVLPLIAVPEAIRRCPGLLIDQEDHYLFVGARFDIFDGYVLAVWRGRRQYVHRIILHADVGQVVDHKNFNTLDNRRGNLHLVDPDVSNQHRFLGELMRNIVQTGRHTWTVTMQARKRRYIVNTRTLYDAMIVAELLRRKFMQGAEPLDLESLLGPAPAALFPLLYLFDELRPRDGRIKKTAPAPLTQKCFAFVKKTRRNRRKASSSARHEIRTYKNFAILIEYMRTQGRLLSVVQNGGDQSHPKKAYVWGTNGAIGILEVSRDTKSLRPRTRLRLILTWRCQESSLAA